MSFTELGIHCYRCAGIGTQVRSLIGTIDVLLYSILWIVATGGEAQGEASHCYI